MTSVQFCRICFRNNNILKKLNELDIDGVKLYDKLKSCVPEILYSSELEKFEMICIECCQFLKTAYMFKELCLRSNILLQSCLIRTENTFSLSETVMDSSISNQTDNSEYRDKYSSLPKKLINTCFSESEESDKSERNDSKKPNHQINEITTESTFNIHFINTKKTDKKPKSRPVFACFHCNRNFSKKTYLKKHMYIHSGERPYVCYMCNMTFNRKNTLETHILIHSGIKNYQCNVCGKFFRLKCALDRHLLIHSKHKAFKCEVCGKAFGRKDHLEKHGKVHRHLHNDFQK